MGHPNHRWPLPSKFWKPSENPLIPMVGPSKKIQWWWSNVVKTIEKPLKAMVAWKKPLTIPSLWKIDHRCGLIWKYKNIMLYGNTKKRRKHIPLELLAVPLTTWEKLRMPVSILYNFLHLEKNCPEPPDEATWIGIPFLPHWHKS